MQSLSVDLDDETLQALEVERSLIGFESRDAYVRWIIANRAAIEQETEMGDVLSAYSDRIERLESRLETIESEESATESATDERASAGDGQGPASPSATADVDTGSEESGTQPAPGDVVQPTTSDGGWTDSDTGSDGETSTGTQSGDEDGISAKNLRPERVERIRDDRLSDDAGILGTVEGDRLDEMSRRAVAKTREQLDRGVETGLEYQSSTRLAASSDDVRPGEDVADLDEISVPGRSSDLVERRQELVGVALALLRDEGAAKKSDFVDALYEEYPAGYGSSGGWWRCLKDGLKQVDAVAGGDGSRIWRLED